MTYNIEINERVGGIVMPWPDTKAKGMFGGLCHLLNGHMARVVYKDYLIDK